MDNGEGTFKTVCFSEDKDIFNVIKTINTYG